MKAETIKIPETHGICAPQPKGGNMEVEERASPVQTEASSRANPRARHPHDVDDPIRTPEICFGKEGAAMNDGKDFKNAPGRSVEIDVARYQKYLDDPALDDEQKEEIIKALWSIMMAFVDLGFGVHPVQEVCGEIAETLDQDGNEDSNEGNPDFENLSAEFNAASDDT